MSALELHSLDGDQAFPGSLPSGRRFWTLEDRRRVEYTAHPDPPTPVNLTSHAYFNLDGEGDGHRLTTTSCTLPADPYPPSTATGHPARPTTPPR